MLTEDTFKKIEELEAACQDTTDNIKKPSHYQGRHGMEAIDVVKNFAACQEHEEGFYWGNAVKYLLRYHAKNGVDIAIVKYGEKDYLKNTDLAYVVCDKIVDADSISFVYHGEYETWHFKLLNTEAN